MSRRKGEKMNTTERKTFRHSHRILAVLMAIVIVTSMLPLSAIQISAEEVDCIVTVKDGERT